MSGPPGPSEPPAPPRWIAAVRNVLVRALLPRRFREDRAEEMEATFRELAAEASRRGGRTGLLGALFREGVDLWIAACSLRGRRLRQRVGGWSGKAGEMRRDLASGLARDAALAGRSLARRPTFAALVVTTVGLGVGGGTAVFTLVDRVLLDPLEYPEPDRLVQVFLTLPDLGWERGPVSLPVFDDWRRENDVFEGLAAYQAGLGRTVRIGGETRLVHGTRVSGELFAVLAVPPSEGRWIRPEDEGAGQEPVVVLSHGLGTELFGADADVVGRRVALGGEPHTVVGVMPPDFVPLRDGTRFWVPFPWEPGGLERDMSFLSVLGRLRAGVGHDAARSSLAALSRRMEAADPAGLAGRSVRIESRKELVTGEVERPLLLLLGAVGLLLAIACANLAGIALARGADRRRELAVRRALGAERLHLARLLGLEALVAGAAGCALAVPVSILVLGVLLAAAPADLPRLEGVSLDGGSLLFAGCVGLLMVLAFGGTPALLRPSADAGAALREGGRGSTGVLRFQRLLVVGQVSVALVLLTGAGLFVTSQWKLARVERGFDGRGVLTFRLHPPSGAYEDPAELDAMYGRVVEGLRGLPGVTAVGATWALPFGEASASSWYGIEGRPDAGEHLLQVVPVRADYFAAMGIAPVRGRLFRPGDGENGAPVTVVNEALAETAWPGQDPVGRRLRKEGETVEVVGVVPDVALTALGEAPQLLSFRPHAAAPWARELYFAVRTGGHAAADPAALVPSVRAVIARVDERIPASDVATMSGRERDQLAPFRFRTLVVGAFALLASLLVLIGVYGVTALLVVRRRREMGVRMALGADRRSLLAGVLAEGGRLALGGALLGLVAAALSARALEGLLYGVEPLEPGVYAAAAAAVVAVAVAAAWIPARRAGGVDPLEALRAE